MQLLGVKNWALKAVYNWQIDENIKDECSSAKVTDELPTCRVLLYDRFQVSS
jgi:hypothetical protein